MTQNIKLFIITAILLLTAIHLPGVLHARGTATSMGYLQTVSTDGPFDVLRNPAVLPWQGSNHSGGIEYFIMPWSYNSIDTSIDLDIESSALGNLGVTDESFTIDPTKQFAFGGNIAYAMKITEDLSLGLAISDSFSMNESKENISFSITVPAPTSAEILFDSNSDDFKFNFHTSLGFKIADQFSMGLHVGIKTNNSKTHAFNTETSTQNAYAVNSSSSISAELSYHLFYKSGNHETGINIYSGNFTWNKYSYKNSLKDTAVPANDYDVSGKTSYEGTYSEGAGIMAGHHWRINRFFAMAIEAGCSIPITVKTRELEHKNGFYMDKAIKGKIKSSYLASLGFEINPVKSITIAFGGGYRQIKTESEKKVDTDDYYSMETSLRNLHLITASTGIIFDFLSSAKIVFTTGINTTLSDSTANKNETDKFGPTVIDVVTSSKTDILNISFNPGITFVQEF